MTDQGILLQLYRQTHKVAAWKILGLLLRLDKSILDKIERERHRVDDCRLEMLHAWLNSNPKDPFRQMKAALEELQPAITTSEKGLHKFDEMKLDSAKLQEIRQLKKKFTTLSVQANRLLKKHWPDPIEAVVSINEGMRGTQEEPLVIGCQVSSHEELFSQLQKTWSYTNPELFESLVIFLNDHIENHETSTLATDLENYLEALNGLKESFMIDQQMVNKGFAFEEHDPSKPCLLLKITAMKKLALKEVDVFLDEVVGVHTRYLRIHKVQSGCIEIIFQFPCNMTKIFEECIERKALIIEHYGHMEIYPPKQKSAQSSTYIDYSPPKNTPPTQIRHTRMASDPFDFRKICAHSDREQEKKRLSLEIIFHNIEILVN